MAKGIVTDEIIIHIIIGALMLNCKLNKIIHL